MSFIFVVCFCHEGAKTLIFFAIKTEGAKFFCHEFHELARIELVKIREIRGKLFKPLNYL
ncbi:hypothetical protein EAH81_07220 [Flavobacterium pectinovorum]|uniref:Uncharacterized protein n=1 Tax=Flavobacterium pectinovorum TaxID=29533 RepID=A0A502EYM1_9FLAO|nr:hypothetical protein EAH81_07220 [Flavobacterium pectinovorum]